MGAARRRRRVRHGPGSSGVVLLAGSGVWEALQEVLTVGARQLRNVWSCEELSGSAGAVSSSSLQHVAGAAAR